MAHHDHETDHDSPDVGAGPTEDADGTTQSDAGLAGAPAQNAAPESPDDDETDGS